MNTHAEHQADIDLLAALVADIEIAMLVSVAADGSLVSRPLATLRTEPDGSLWFFTSAATGKVDDIGRQPQVNLAYADPGNETYVSVTGRARVLVDPERAAALWHPRARAFFPGGPEDPDLRLIRVEVEAAEYWRPSTGLSGQALRLMQAITGQGPSDPGEHGHLEVRD